MTIKWGGGGVPQPVEYFKLSSVRYTPVWSSLFHISLLFVLLVWGYNLIILYSSFSKISMF